MSSGSSDERGIKWWLSRVVVPLLVPLVGAAALFLLNQDGDEGGEPRGAIAFPKDGSRIPRSFTAEGTLGDVPGDDHVWLAVRSDNLLFPKEPEIEARSHWIMESIEAGIPPGGRFSLVLLLTGAAGERQIQDWLDRGRATGSYPGLEQIAGSEELDAASALVLPR